MPVPLQIHCAGRNHFQPQAFAAGTDSGGRRLGGSVMERAEQYRRYAAECLRLTQELRLGSRGAALLLEMAERWRSLAEQVERRELVSEQRK